MNTARITQILAPDAAGIQTAAALIAAGQQVAFPTETVYGLGADARNASAVAGIYAAKGRPSFNPLIVHLARAEQAAALVDWPETAALLARHFWPGPLTMVLPLKDGHGICSLVTAGLDTLAVRVPAHPTAAALLRACDAPLAAPSANPSGRISATTPEHVRAGLDGRIAGILADGPCPVGVESTIVGITGTTCTQLRAGGIARGAIEEVLGAPLTDPTDASITAPGQLTSHYAPGAAVRLNAETARAGEVMLGFGPKEATLNLSPTGDLTEAAANLFAHLHLLDAMGKPIAVAPIPEQGLGRAINDRLRRAAAPRTGD